ncbi:hypothetical protein [Pseudoalteromonas sp. JB197]|uniref:hypothetical protein n=1 Tax=Pseudoalteromonas sp. JB197 TaxID=1434839 RepID=UPI00097F33C0|nr:hypothetical protein [Pseudoalteromonas sp. JB197]PCC12901.1 hypothetical protein CIK86_06200 [Pseudoalteromonas sp. JB197]SJN25530.1 hypothetical protein CZ797_04285 [Pseudoalteromonas sp. JB197]
MGGKSSSSQSTSNLQTTNNIVNDGDYAGVGGNVTHDESSNDNSVDNSQEWEIDIDNSQEWDIDNSVENDGDFAGNSGNINVLDGGAIKGAFDFASDALSFGEKALDANKDVSKAAIDAANKAAATAAKTAADAIKENGRVVDASLDFAGDAVKQVGNTANTAINEVGDFGRSTISDFSEFSLDAVTELSDSLRNATQTQLNNSAQTVAQIAQSASEDKAIISELAKNTALQGQDIVAEQAGQMIKYMAIALGVIGIAVAITAMARSK